MPLLAGKLYDPAAAVAFALTGTSKVMTALDTTNLRLTFTVPASGIVAVRQAGVVWNASAYPEILIGVLESSTVRGRMVPQWGVANPTLATGLRIPFEALFLVTGLTAAASLTWDAAVGTENSSGQIEYGGPNDTTGNNAFGGYAFEIWSVS